MNEPLRTYARPPFFNFRIALTPFSRQSDRESSPEWSVSHQCPIQPIKIQPIKILV